MLSFGRVRSAFDRLANKAARYAGTPTAFALALGCVIVWAFLGPIFQYSDTWQLVINTSTTIITFLMVFLVQHSQNKDSHALHAKLNELIAAAEGASNRLIDLEDLTDEEIEHVEECFRKLAQEAPRLKPGARTSIDAHSESESEPQRRKRKRAK